MKQLALVFIGGGLGTALRYGIGKWTSDSFTHFTLGTFSVNMIGSLIIGIVLGLVAKNSSISQNTVVFIATGFCGGFTTFSTFAYENYTLLKDGDLITFAIYTIGSLALGIGAVIFGIWLARFY